MSPQTLTTDAGRSSSALSLSASALDADCLVDPPRALSRPACEPAIPAAPAASARLPGVDAARGFAAISTVWLHTVASTTLRPTADWARYAVPLFNLLAGWFLVAHARRHRAEPFRGYAVSRLNRLYIPFLIWNLAYIVARDAKRRWLTGEPAVALDVSMLFIGTAEHMWYLPFLLMWSLAGFWVVRWAVGSRHRELGVAIALLLAGLVIAVCPQPIWYSRLPFPGYFLERTWVRVPSLLWGVGAGLIATPSIRAARIPPVAAVLGALWLVGCIVAWETVGQRALFQNLAGVGLVVMGLTAMPGIPRTVLALLGRYGYAIFLLHTLFIESARSLAELVGLGRSVPLDLSLWLFAVLACVATASLARRWALPKWLIPT